MDKDKIIKQLQAENAMLREQLNKYLLKNNKEEHKKRVKDYQERINYKATPEKLDENWRWM